MQKISFVQRKKNHFYDFSVEKMTRFFWKNCFEILSVGSTVEFQKIESENRKKKISKDQKFFTFNQKIEFRFELHIQIIEKALGLGWGSG